MLMHNPPHPGEIIKELCLEPLGISVTDAADALGISRKTLSAILNGRAGSWLNQQSQYELWHAEQHRSELQVKKLVAA
jgi:plasmid maintenance system antidote protein VapI